MTGRILLIALLIMAVSVYMTARSQQDAVGPTVPGHIDELNQVCPD